MMIQLQFPDGNIKEFEKGVKVYEVAEAISPSLKKKTFAASIDGVLYDFNRPIETSGKIILFTEGSKEAFQALNHSTAHLMAQAVKKFFPNAQFGVGPAIEEGFYYDIDAGETPIREEDFEKIEKEMKRLSDMNIELTRSVVTKEEALKNFAHDIYKQELISGIPESEEITFYTQGDFTDLCAGGHVGYTGRIKNFKILSIAGAYWRGDSNNKQLQRLYGTSHFSKKELEDYLQLLIERKERDHRKIGKEMELFTFNDLAGKGLPMWLPNGATIRRELERYIVDKELMVGYEHVYTPIMGSVDLYKTSGHWDHYSEDMFPVMSRDGEEYVLRPMNCPHHMLVYKTKPRSYKDLPIRLGELGTDHRFEKSGALTGLERVRGMCMNDAHLFVRPDQIAEEFKSVIDLVHEAYADFDIQANYYRLSLRDPEDKEKYFDNDEMWDYAENMLRTMLEEAGIPFVEAIGEAAFYGPKLDIQIKTAMGHEATLSTAQLDFLLPEKFELEYIDKDDTKKRPIVIHRAIISTMERMTSFLIEEYKGAFPFWLAPRQITVIPVSNNVHSGYAEKVISELKGRGFRVYLDQREEKLGYKIRESQTTKVPYTLVLGDNEVENNTVTYRQYGKQESKEVTLEQFIAEREIERIQKGRKQTSCGCGCNHE